MQGKRVLFQRDLPLSLREKFSLYVITYFYYQSFAINLDCGDPFFHLLGVCFCNIIFPSTVFTYLLYFDNNANNVVAENSYFYYLSLLAIS